MDLVILMNEILFVSLQVVEAKQKAGKKENVQYPTEFVPIKIGKILFLDAQQKLLFLSCILLQQAIDLGHLSGVVLLIDFDKFRSHALDGNHSFQNESSSK